MPVTPYLAKQMLDWVTGAAAATRPGQRWVSFATQSPTTESAFDGPFNTRVSARFAAANSPQMSATLATNATLATATAVATVVGWNLWDSTAGGTRLMYGTATANIGCKSSDNVQIQSGSWRITLS